MFNVELNFGYRTMYFQFETLELAQDFIKVAMNAECMSDEESSSEFTATLTFRKTYEKEEK